MVAVIRELSHTPAAASRTQRPISRSCSQHFYSEETEEAAMKLQIMLNRITANWTRPLSVRKRAPLPRAGPPKAICPIDCRDKEEAADRRPVVPIQMVLIEFP